MGISNDWQNISGLTYTTKSNATFIDEDSLTLIANAIGWEVVNLGDYVSDVTLYNSVTIDASYMYLMRPVADSGEEEYNTGISPFFYQRWSNWIAGHLVIELSTGTIIGCIYNNSVSGISNAMILRPSATGCFALANTSKSSIALFDKFYNPKSEDTKWCIFNPISTNTPFCDLYTGLTIGYTYSYLSATYNSPNDIGQFVALKKFTAISTSGVYNAKTIYKSYIDYSNSSKTIEIGGKQYHAIAANYTPFYIPLAD